MSNRPILLYLLLVAVAIGVTLLSLTGFAAVAGHLPSAMAATHDAVPVRHVAVAKPVCGSCGVVESVRLVRTKGAATGVGAVAGGVIGAVLGNQIGAGNGRAAMTLLGAGGGAVMGNEIEKDTRHGSSYQVRVRLDNGTVRVLYQREEPMVDVGDRVRIVRGVAVLAG